MAKRKFRDKDGVWRESFNANPTSDVVRAFKEAMLRRNIEKIQDALTEAMQEWAEREQGMPLVPVPALTKSDTTHVRPLAKVKRWESAHIQLDAILNSGDTEAQTAILSNLAVFSRVAVKSDEREPLAISATDSADLLYRAQAALDRTYEAEEEENVATKKSGRNRRDTPGGQPGDRRKPEQVG